uniref:Thioredoxin domain-containing protein n=1 Tax=viral metagenome TaxID=1070528 RepID=A0A6C0EVG8_9ZZZZ
MTKKTGKTRKTGNKKKVKFNSRVTVHKIEPSNSSDFEEHIKGMNGTILYHHPQCIHCVMLRPKWNQMIQKLKQQNVNCRIMEINADALNKIHGPLGKVDGFPKIINVTNGIEKDVFNDTREVENMLQFVLKNLKGEHNLPYDYNLNEKNRIVKLKTKQNIQNMRNKLNNTYRLKHKIHKGKTGKNKKNKKNRKTK